MEEAKSQENVGQSPVKDENIRVIVSTPNADATKAAALVKIKRMIEQKEVKVIEEKKALIDQGNLNEVDLKTLLTKDDQEFYYEKKKQYLDKYPDLGDDPFDMDDLHDMIMEQIIQRTLLRKKKIRPTADISKEYESSKKRQADAKRSLSMRRTDRVKTKGEKKQVLNIANLSMNFSDPDKGRVLLDRLKELRQEENTLDDSEKVVE